MASKARTAACAATPQSALKPRPNPHLPHPRADCQPAPDPARRLQSPRTSINAHQRPHSLQKQEQIKGPENAPIARFQGLCRYQTRSKTGEGSHGRSNGKNRFTASCPAGSEQTLTASPGHSPRQLAAFFALNLIAAKPVKPCDGGVFGALDLLSEKEQNTPGSARAKPLPCPRLRKRQT